MHLCGPQSDVSNRDTRVEEEWHEDTCRERGHVTLMTQAIPRAASISQMLEETSKHHLIPSACDHGNPNLACQPPDARQYISTISSHPVCSPWYGSRGNLIDTPAYVTF